MAVRRGRLEAECERDLAIEEAAVAYHELSRLRSEVEQLRREKAVWEAGQDAWSTRHEQILWHVGAMAEMLWCTFQQSHDGSCSSCSSTNMSVEDAKLLALESFAQLTPKHDAQMYEEMHALYAKIAHMEAQHSEMAEKIRQLKRIKEDIREKQRNWGEPHAREDTRDTKQRINGDGPVLADGLAVIHPLPEESARDRTAALSHEVSPSDTHDVELLQAQLAMYINYTKRHGPSERVGAVVDSRIDR